MRRLEARIGWTLGPVAQLAAAIVLGLMAALFAAGFTIGGTADVAVHPVAMAALLAMAALPLIKWAAAGNATVQWIGLAGLVAKGVGTYARVRFNETGADSSYYHSAGQQVAEVLSSGLVGPDDPRLLSRGTGTNHLSYLVGLLYHVTGPRLVTAFIVWSFIAFVGMLCFYKAAIQAIPELDRVRYALLLFLMPSMLFWPSSLGKDALLVGCLGVATLGASALARQRYSLLPLLALGGGLGLAAWIRPHVAALVILALAAAVIWPHRGGKKIRQIAVAAALLIVLTFALGQSADYFGAERFEATTLLDRAANRTSEGGSEFTPVRVSGPASFALAVVTVLFRPLPIEASSIFQLGSSVEGAMLLVFALASFERLRLLPRMFLERAYVRFCVIYMLGFIMAFSVISNFGILARQRSQLWPFVLVLLALPRRDRLVEPVDPTSATTTEPNDQPTATGSDLYVP